MLKVLILSLKILKPICSKCVISYQIRVCSMFLDAIASLEIPIVVVTHSLTHSLSQSQLSLEVLFPLYTMLSLCRAL
jgi:hypothetical protein